MGASSLDDAPRRTHRVARGAVGVLLVLVSSLSLFVTGVLNVVGRLAGSPDALATNVLDVATSPSVRRAVATEVVDQLQRDVSGRVGATFAAHREQLIVAVESVIADPETQRVAREVLEALDGAWAGGSTKVDLRPLLVQFTQVMHAVDPSVSSQPVDLRHSVVTVHRSAILARFFGSILPAELVFLVLGVVALTINVGFVVRRPSRQYAMIAFAFADPAIVFLVVGAGSARAVAHVSYPDASDRAITVASVRQLSSAVTSTGVLYVVLGLAAMAAWYAGRRWRDTRHRSGPPIVA